jgi:hypothetical protein
MRIAKWRRMDANLAIPADPLGKDDISGILDATCGPEDLHVSDRRGLTPVAYAALEAVPASTALLPLLTLLDPPEAGEDRMGQMLALMESIYVTLGKLETKIHQIADDSKTPGLRSVSPLGAAPAFQSITDNRPTL